MDEKIKGYINKIVYCLLAVSICVNVVFISINSRTDKSYKDARATVDKLNGELTDISKTIGAAGTDYTTLKEKLDELETVYRAITISTNDINKSSSDITETSSNINGTVDKLGNEISGSDELIRRLEQSNKDITESNRQCIEQYSSIIKGTDSSTGK